MTEVILTSYFATRKDPQRNLFVGKDNFAYIEPWYLSMKNAGLHGIIFHDHLSPEFVSKYTTPDIKFQKVDLTKYKCTSLCVLRFFVYKDYLQTLSATEKPRKLFMTDVSDVTVVQSPFKLVVNPDAIYVGDEPKTNGSSKWMEKDYKNAHLPYEFMKNEMILNAGVVGGFYCPIMLLLMLMCDHFATMPDSDANCDMATLNFCIRTNWSKENIICGSPLNSVYKNFENQRQDVFFIHK